MLIPFTTVSLMEWSAALSRRFTCCDLKVQDLYAEWHIKDLWLRMLTQSTDIR